MGLEREGGGDRLKSHTAASCSRDVRSRGRAVRRPVCTSSFRDRNKETAVTAELLFSANSVGSQLARDRASTRLAATASSMANTPLSPSSAA